MTNSSEPAHDPADERIELGKLEEQAGQFSLLGSRRFAPLFWTQFLGAFNDNVIKSALSLLFVYGG